MHRCLDRKGRSSKGRHSDDDKEQKQHTELVTIPVNETDSTEDQETHAARTRNNSGGRERRARHMDG